MKANASAPANAEKPEHDRRGRQQDVVDEADHGAELACASVLGKPGSCRDPQRRADEDSQTAHHQTAEQGIGEATLGLRRWRGLGEQSEADATQAVAERRPQYPEQEDEAEDGSGATKQHRNCIASTTTAINFFDETIRVAQVCGWSSHQVPSRRARRLSISRAIARTTKVTINSTKPSNSSAER